METAPGHQFGENGAPRLLPVISFQSAPQSDNLALQPQELVDLQVRGFEDATGDLPRLFPECSPSFGQTHPYLAFIDRITGSLDVA